MIIELTVAQAEALDNALFTEDDALRQFPIPLVGELGMIVDDDDNVTGYVMAHEDLTFEDEVVLHTLLDDRIAALETIRRLPSADRPAARAAIRTGLRQDARKAARVEQRQEDRQGARQEMRRDIRQDTRIAARIAAREKEREAEQQP